MVGAIVGAGISAVGSIAGGAMQSGNAGAAQKTSQRNLEMILPQMQTNYVNTLAQYQPYAAAGGQGLTATQDLLGLNGPDAAAAAMNRFQTSPGYEWQLGEGLRAVDAGAAARGMLRSGATLKAEEAYGQGLANQDFGNYYNRLNALAGQGLTAASGIASANQNLIANEEGNAQSQNAVALGGANAQNSIIGNTTSGLGNTLNSLMQNKGVNSWLTGLFSPSTPAWNPAGGLNYTPGTSPGYGNQTFQSGGVF